MDRPRKPFLERYSAVVQYVYLGGGREGGARDGRRRPGDPKAIG